LSLFGNIFSKEKQLKECPRCLGKGKVEWDDIRRMDRELKWRPGACAYCNGVGKIDPEIEKNVAIDTTYLSTGISKEERGRLIKGDPGALERAHQHEMEADYLITQICYLHFEGKMNSGQITDFYFLGGQEMYPSHKKEFSDHVEKVIEVKSRDNKQ
jgi:hypothetical protein